MPPVLDGRGGGKSFTIAARESTTSKSTRIFRRQDLGLRSDGPQAGLPYLGPTMRHEAARRQRGHLGHDQVARRDRERLPA